MLPTGIASIITLYVPAASGVKLPEYDVVVAELILYHIHPGEVASVQLKLLGFVLKLAISAAVTLLPVPLMSFAIQILLLETPLGDVIEAEYDSAKFVVPVIGPFNRAVGALVTGPGPLLVGVGDPPPVLPH